MLIVCSLYFEVAVQSLEKTNLIFTSKILLVSEDMKQTTNVLRTSDVQSRGGRFSMLKVTASSLNERDRCQSSR